MTIQPKGDRDGRTDPVLAVTFVLVAFAVFAAMAGTDSRDSIGDDWARS